MTNQENVIRKTAKDVIVIDYALNPADLNEGYVGNLISYYLKLNSYSHTKYSGVPFLLNLRLVQDRGSDLESSRWFVKGSKDDVPKPYTGYNPDGSITPIDAYISVPIFPVCFSDDILKPLFRMICSNYQQLGNESKHIEDIIQMNQIKDNSVVFDIDRIRDEILEFSIDRYQQSYDNISDLYKNISEWFERYDPQEKAHMLKFLNDCFGYTSDQLLQATKFVAYADRENIEKYSDMTELKDETKIDKEVGSLTAVLLKGFKKKLADYYHLLQEMSYADADEGYIQRDATIGDLSTSAYHAELAKAIKKSGFFDNSPDKKSPVYDYMFEQEQQVSDSHYANQKFFELLVKMIKLYGGGGAPQKRYCEQLDNSGTVSQKKETEPRTQPQAKKKNDLWHNLLNKLGFNNDNGNGPQNPAN